MIRRMMFASLKNSGGAPSGILKINMSSSGDPAITTWNNWTGGNSTKVLNDSAGNVMAVKLVEVDVTGMTFDSGYISHAVNDPDFPDATLNTTGYVALNEIKGFEIRGLNPAKTYTIITATYPNTYDISYGKTNHVINGLTKVALNTTDAIYKNTFTAVAPSAGGIVTMTIGGFDSNNYGFLSAMIIKEE